jgi:inner membrane protein
LTAKGHVLLALPFAIEGLNYFGIRSLDGIWLTITIVVGALFPDIDEPKSYIGRRFWFMSWPIKLLSKIMPPLKHRGLTHLFFVPLSMGIIAHYFENIWLGGFALGWFLHTVGDLITVGGIQGYLFPFWSNKKMVLLPDSMRFYTGGIVEKVLISILAVMNGYLIFKLGVI